MRTRSARAVLWVAPLLCCLAAGQESEARSSKIKCGDHCQVYLRTDSLPEEPPPGTVRLAIGGDSRNDRSHVVSWAFKEARRRGAKAFFFLGDLKLTPSLDKRFLRDKLKDLAPVPFYPLMGNHEVETLGVLRLGRKESELRVKKFQQRFLTAPGIVLAPFKDEVVYSADLEGGLHLVALDNVSRRGEGFGSEQLKWLATDLKSASAAKKIILVGMHKPLAGNPITSHAMDEDGPEAVRDSDAALHLFEQYHVAMVVVSHSHMYAAYCQGAPAPATSPCPSTDSTGIEVRLTGGMGAPLVKGLAEADGGFHHFLLVDVPAGHERVPLSVEVVKFPGQRDSSSRDESEEVE